MVCKALVVSSIAGTGFLQIEKQVFKLNEDLLPSKLLLRGAISMKDRAK